MKVSKNHTYIRPEGDNTGVVGITQFAADQLGEVVLVDLPEVGKAFSRDEDFGVIESVKAVSALYAPVSGKVVEINAGLPDHPEWVNEDPYGKGWMLKLAMSDPAEYDAALTPEQYEAEVAT